MEPYFNVKVKLNLKKNVLPSNACTQRLGKKNHGTWIWLRPFLQPDCVQRHLTLRKRVLLLTLDPWLWPRLPDSLSCPFLLYISQKWARNPFLIPHQSSWTAGLLTLGFGIMVKGIIILCTLTWDVRSSNFAVMCFLFSELDPENNGSFLLFLPFPFDNSRNPQFSEWKYSFP